VERRIIILTADELLLLDKEIEIDRLKNFSEDTIFLNEDNNQEKLKSPEHIELQDKNQAYANKKAAIAKTKEIITNLNKLKTEKDEDTLINGYTTSLHSLIKLALLPGIISVVVNPIVGVITLMGKLAMDKKVNKSNRKKLYVELYGDLRVVDDKIKRLNKKEDEEGLTDEEQKEKYALMKLQIQLRGKCGTLQDKILH
jgi:hypothetical protein